VCVSVSCSVVSNSSWPYGLEPARLLCPWGFPGKNIGVGCLFLLQGIFPIQGSNPGEGEWDPWYCHHFHIYSSCCFERNSQRFNINSRGWIPIAEPGICSELRVWKALTSPLLSPSCMHDGQTTTAWQILPPFLIKVSHFFLRISRPPCSFIHLTGIFSFTSHRHHSNCWGDRSKQNWQKYLVSWSLHSRDPAPMFRQRWLYPWFMRSPAQAQPIRVANPHGYGDWFKEKHAFELECWRRLLRVPWTARRSNQSILKEINPEYLLRTDAVAETPILWPQDAKSQLTGKDLDAWKDWRQEEKGATEDEMVGWHHRLNGHKSEQTPEGGEVQGSLVCCSPRSYKELDTTEQLNKNPKTFSGIIRREACSFLF